MNNARTIKINARSAVRALIFLEDGKHLLSGGEDGVIRQWRVEDGREVEQAIRASSAVWAIALSSDSKWIVGGEAAGVATVWNKSTRQSACTVKEHLDKLYTVDVSPDSTKFATGSRDFRASIWDISTGRRLIGPLYHDFGVISVRFSPGGDRIATTTWDHESLRIYNTHNGELLSNIPVTSNARNSIAWSGDSQYIFSLSSDILSRIHVDTGSLVSEWTLPGETQSHTGSIALSSNGKFIASFVGHSLSFWDPYTAHRRFGPVFDHPGGPLRSITLSLDNKYVATGGENGTITVRNLNDIIPTSYLVSQSQLRLEPQVGRGAADLQRQIEALRGALHALEFRFDALTETTMQLNDRLQAQAAPLRISDGTYRIKSSTGDVYLARLQPTTVVVQPSDPSSGSQRWTISLVADGAYSIAGRIGNLDIPLSTGNANQLVCVPGNGPTSWTFEPRGDAYVIGNSVNAAAIHCARGRQSVSVIPRNNSQNQRWVLERVSN